MICFYYISSFIFIQKVLATSVSDGDKENTEDSYYFLKYYISGVKITSDRKDFLNPGIISKLEIPRSKSEIVRETLLNICRKELLKCKIDRNTFEEKKYTVMIKNIVKNFINKFTMLEDNALIKMVNDVLAESDDSGTFLEIWLDKIKIIYKVEKMIKIDTFDKETYFYEQDGVNRDGVFVVDYSFMVYISIPEKLEKKLNKIYEEKFDLDFKINDEIVFYQEIIDGKKNMHDSSELGIKIQEFYTNKLKTPENICSKLEIIFDDFKNESINDSIRVLLAELYFIFQFFVEKHNQLAKMRGYDIIDGNETIFVSNLENIDQIKKRVINELINAEINISRGFAVSAKTKQINSKCHRKESYQKDNKKEEIKIATLLVEILYRFNTKVNELKAEYEKPSFDQIILFEEISKELSILKLIYLKKLKLTIDISFIIYQGLKINYRELKMFYRRFKEYLDIICFLIITALKSWFNILWITFSNLKNIFITLYDILQYFWMNNVQLTVLNEIDQDISKKHPECCKMLDNIFKSSISGILGDIVFDFSNKKSEGIFRQYFFCKGLKLVSIYGFDEEISSKFSRFVSSSRKDFQHILKKTIEYLENQSKTDFIEKKNYLKGEEDQRSVFRRDSKISRYSIYPDKSDEPKSPPGNGSSQGGESDLATGSGISVGLQPSDSKRLSKNPEKFEDCTNPAQYRALIRKRDLERQRQKE